MGKVYTRFQTKMAQKPYSMGRRIPIYNYIREYPPRVWDNLLTQPFSVYRNNFAAGWMNLGTVKAALHKEDVSLIALFMFPQIIHDGLTF